MKTFEEFIEEGLNGKNLQNAVFGKTNADIKKSLPKFKRRTDLVHAPGFGMVTPAQLAKLKADGTVK